MPNSCLAYKLIFAGFLIRFASLFVLELIFIRMLFPIFTFLQAISAEMGTALPRREVVKSLQSSR